MSKEISQKQYPLQYKVIQDMMDDLGIHCHAYVYQEDRYTGKAGGKGIFITSAVLNDYSQSPYILKFFAAHELIHYQHKEFGIKKGLNLIGAVLVSIIGVRNPLRKLFAHSLLSEMRCNINGASLAKLSHTEMIKSQDETQKKNNESVRPKSYESGYPDREMIKEYILKYKQFDYTVANIILHDYCTLLKINNSESFIDEVLAEFFNNKAY